MLVGLTSQVLTSGGGFASALFAFGVASVVVVGLMFGLSLAIALAQARTVQRLRSGAPSVRKWGGRILVALGTWFVVLAVFPHPFTHVFHV